MQTIGCKLQFDERIKNKRFKYKSITQSLMRTLNLVLEDEDFDKLEKAKGESTWREFIVQLAKK